MDKRTEPQIMDESGFGPNGLEPFDPQNEAD